MLKKAGFQKIRLLTSGLNPAEMVNYYRRGSNGNAGFKRVEAAYELNEALTRSPLRRAVKNGLNGVLNTLGLGDSLKIFAIKGGDAA